MTDQFKPAPNDMQRRDIPALENMSDAEAVLANALEQAAEKGSVVAITVLITPGSNEGAPDTVDLMATSNVSHAGLARLFQDLAHGQAQLHNAQQQSDQEDVKH